MPHTFGTQEFWDVYGPFVMNKTKAAQAIRETKEDKERSDLEKAISQYGGETELTPAQQRGRGMFGDNVAVNMPGTKTALGARGEQEFGAAMPAMVREGKFQRATKILDATDKSVGFISKVLSDPELSPDKKKNYINALNTYASNLGLGNNVFSVDDDDVQKKWKDTLYEELVINRQGKGPVADFWKKPTVENMNLAIRSLNVLGNKIGTDKVLAEKQAIRAHFQKSKEGPTPQSPIGKLQADLASAKIGKNKAEIQARIDKLTQGSESWSGIELSILQKALAGKDLKPLEQKVLDRKLEGKSLDRLKAEYKAKMDARIESFTEKVGRPPTEEEIRNMFLTDPFGFLSMGIEKLPEGLTDAMVNFYIKNHDMTREQVIAAYKKKQGIK